MPLKMHELLFFSRKKKCAYPTKIFQAVTRNTLMFLFGLMAINVYMFHSGILHCRLYVVEEAAYLLMKYLHK